MLLGIRFSEVRGQPENRTIALGPNRTSCSTSSRSPRRPKTSAAPRPASRRTQPPLYYALRGDPLRPRQERHAARSAAADAPVSALLAGLTALFAFLFVREALPGVALGLDRRRPRRRARAAARVHVGRGEPGLDAVRGLGRALLLSSRARSGRGLDVRRAVAIGALTAIGFLTKLNFIGLAPGVFLGLVVLERSRGPRVGAGAPRYRLLALVARRSPLSPVALYALVNVLSGHPCIGARLGDDRRLTHAVDRRRDQLHLAALPAAAAGDGQRLPRPLTTHSCGSTGLCRALRLARHRLPGLGLAPPR